MSPGHLYTIVRLHVDTCHEAEEHDKQRNGNPENTMFHSMRHAVNALNRIIDSQLRATRQRRTGPYQDTCKQD